MMMRSAVLLFLLLVLAPTQALAETDGENGSCSPSPVERARNRDGSVLTLATECPTPDVRRYVITLDCADSHHCDQLEIEQPGEYAPTGRATLIDLGDDGMHEVEISGACDAGPNCEGNVYSIDPAAGKLVHLFSGGYAELLVRDGWLVESGRSSCCSWEHHLWKLGSTNVQSLEYDNMDFMVKVGALMGDDDFDCVFLRRSGDNWHAAAPPSHALETLCEVYGEGYRLKPPDPKLNAEAQRQEQ